MIEINNLAVHKGGKPVCTVSNLSIAPQEQVAIVGNNGSGKTTLLRVIAGLEDVFQGQCTVGVPRSRRVYVHQSPYLFRGTVLFNAMYGLRARGRSKAESERVALDWLGRLGIRELAARSCNRLSGGERRRAALARAMAAAPSLLLLDEPLAELDEEGVASVLRVLGELSETTVLFSSPTDFSESLLAKECRLWRLPGGG